MGSTKTRLGLWMIGACGGVGSTVALGLAAMRRGLTETAGLVTELPLFKPLDLVSVQPAGASPAIVVGGHEIRSETLPETVKSSHESAGLFDETLIRACAADLRAMQKNVLPGTLCGAAPPLRNMADRVGLCVEESPAESISRLGADIRAFRKRHRLDRVVVVNIASSERLVPHRPAHGKYASLQRELTKKGARALPTSSIYALAAIETGCPYINFTPSTGVNIPAIRKRAEELGVPYMGSDGKTGETLLKSVLAPMFAMRNLRVLSWFGQNILGNRDGHTLRDPATRTAKLKSKDKTVTSIIDGAPMTRTSIDFVPSLHDWKVAWDFIHFRGFLNTKMSMQFTWHGSDSALAAPLVIDLARLAAHFAKTGVGGPMRHLACFFKDPIDVGDHNLFAQWRLMEEYVREAGV